MNRIIAFFSLSLFIFFAASLVGERFHAIAQEIAQKAPIDACKEIDKKPWKVSGTLIGKPTDDANEGAEADGKDKKSKKKAEKGEPARDISGMACAVPSDQPGVCLVVDDESQGSQIVIVKDGKLKAGTFFRLIRNNYKDKLLELDAEAVAYSDQDDRFYVVGSHGRPRNEDDKKDEVEKNDAKTKASRQLIRIKFSLKSANENESDVKLEADPDISTNLSKFLETDEKIKNYFNEPLCANGLTIEGLAILSDRLFIGMRGPVLPNGKALILEGTMAQFFDGAPDKGIWHQVGLGFDRAGKPRGVRDLARHKREFLIIAGPVLDPSDDRVEDGDYAIYSWSGTGNPVEVMPLKSYGTAIKPEALVPLEEADGRLRALLLFDGPEEGAPRTVEFPVP